MILTNPAFIYWKNCRMKVCSDLKTGIFIKKEKKIRTRFLCKDQATKKQFLFSPITEVELVKKGRIDLNSKATKNADFYFCTHKLL